MCICIYIGNMDTRVVNLFILSILLSFSTCTPTFSCNDVVELESPARMNCSLPGPTSVYFSAPNSADIAYCLHMGECISRDRNYVISEDVTNTNITRLDIQHVQRSDEGNWTCTDANTNKTSACAIVVTKTPRCEINSNTGKNDLNVNEEISLTVNVTDYYCSRPVYLLLEVGTATVVLTDSHLVTTKTSDRLTVMFKVAESRFGPVKLIFVCNNIKKPVPCGGIDILHKKAATIERPAARSAIIAGVIVPVVVVICLVGLVVCCLRRRRKKSPAGNLVPSDA